jgi:predicted Zn-dependent peptidase
VASQYFQGRPVSELGRYADDVLAVTPTQVRRFAATVWQPGNLRTVIAGDLTAQADEALVPIGALDLERPGLTA